MKIKCAGCDEMIEKDEAFRWEGELPWYQVNARRYVCRVCLDGYVYWAENSGRFAEAYKGVRFNISNLRGEPIDAVMPNGAIGVMDYRAYTQARVRLMMRDAQAGCVVMAEQLEEDLYEMDTCNQALYRAMELCQSVDWRVS